MNSKRRIIKDPVWGTFDYVSHEAEIMRSPILARLHNVVQNSLAYYVYPGLRYSRFSHSLGVMYVATEIFFSAIKNTDNSKLNNFRELSTNCNFTSNFIRDHQAEIKTLSIYWGLSNHVDVVLLAIIRLKALLHDLGHMPYSHVLEFAVEKFLIKQCEKQGTSYINWNPSEPIHEKLGQSFFTYLDSDLKLKQAAEPFNESMRFGYNLIQLLEHIKAKCPDLDGALKSIISASIDADRIDYLVRDGMCSGLGLGKSIDYQRIFSSYKIIKFGNAFRFLPTKKAQEDIKHFFIERYRNRKLVIAHHRVILMDALLKRIIAELLELNEGFREELIGVIRRSFSLADSTTIPYSINNVSYYFDDSWLDFKIREIRKNYGPESLDDDLIHYLRGFLVDYKKYVSLHKDDNSFFSSFPICEKIATNRNSKDLFDSLSVSSLPGLESEIIAKLGCGKGQIIVEGVKGKLTIGTPKADPGGDANELDYYLREFNIKELFEYLVASHIHSPPFFVYYDRSIEDRRNDILSIVEGYCSDVINAFEANDCKITDRQNIKEDLKDGKK